LSSPKRIILILLCLSLIGCSMIYNGDLAPKRSFSVYDLLITEKDMPSGWHSSSKPGKSIIPDISSIFSAEITFNTDLYPENRGSSYDIFQYETENLAHGDFEQIVATYLDGRKNTIKDWNFISKYANEYATKCLYMKGEKIEVCEYVVRYKEFVILFICWLIPERMSLAQMEDIAKIIDLKIANYLYLKK
jgi:hypothetical protein